MILNCSCLLLYSLHFFCSYVLTSPWLSEVSCFSTERVCADGRGRDEWFGDGRIRRMTICCCFVLSVKMISARFQIHLQLIYNVNESTWRTRWRNEYSCHYSLTSVITVKDCCLRVWLLNLLNAVLSCPVWCLDNDALHEKIYLIYDLSVSQRMTVRRFYFCWNFVLSVQFFFSFFFKFEQHFQSALSSRSCVCPAGRSARNKQSVTKQNLTSRSAAGRIPSLSLFTSWEKNSRGMNYYTAKHWCRLSS